MTGKYYQCFDGWFNYYVNSKTGEKKFALDNGDVLAEQKLDDFCRKEPQYHLATRSHSRRRRSQS